MKAKKIKRVQSFTDRWGAQGFLFTLPTIILVVGLVLVPVCMNFVLALTNYKGFGVPFRFIGLYNFQSIFNDSNFWLVFFNTLKLMFIFVVILNIFAIIFATLISNIGRRFGNFVKSLLYFPCLLAGVVVGFVWKLILNYQKGLINFSLKSLGLDFFAQNWLGDSGLVIPVISLVIVWFATGYYTVIYYAGLMSISPEYYEVGDVEGASALQKFRYVTLPFLAPSITINVVLSTMGVLGTYDLPNALTGGGGPGHYGTTLPMLIVRFVYERRETGRGLAVAVVIALLAVVFAFFELKILQKKEVH